MKREANTFTASISLARTVVCAAVEAVVMGNIAGGVISLTVRMIITHIGHTETTAGVTHVPGVSIRVLLTLACVVTQVTHGGGVLTVEVSARAA